LELSDAQSATFAFTDPPLTIDKSATRVEFESWIERQLAELEACVDRLMRATAVKAESVDSVFLTGGSSFVPAVRRIFERRFGADHIRMGNEFTSVASGLALRALR